MTIGHRIRVVAYGVLFIVFWSIVMGAHDYIGDLGIIAAVVASFASYLILVDHYPKWAAKSYEGDNLKIERQCSAYLTAGMCITMLLGALWWFWELTQLR